MKIKSIFILSFMMIITVLSSCYKYDWDISHETALSGFNLSSDDQNLTIAVNYADSTGNFGHKIQLDWTVSTAEDYSKVFYDVLFYNTQDMTTPVYKAASGFGKTENFLLLNEKELNIIAEKAGIPQLGTGDIRWKVMASNGISELMTNEYKTITISRPAGFAYYPEQLIVAGDAVQSGQSAALRRIVQNDNYTGEYEAFLYLSEGSFYLTEKGSNRRFHITQDDALQELFGNDRESLVNTPILPGKIHRIKINFRTSDVTVAAIESVGIWYSGINDVLAELQQEDPTIPYWSHTGKLELVNDGALPDYRYKFRIAQKNIKGEDTFSFWGYNAASAPNQSETSLPSYFRLYEVDNSQSNYCYKFSRSGQDQFNLKIDVDFRPEAEFFRHYITRAE